MEVPRDTAVDGGRILAVVVLSPWSVPVCAHGTGRASEQGAAACCVC